MSHLQSLQTLFVNQEASVEFGKMSLLLLFLFLFFFFFQKNLRLHLFTLFTFKINSSSTPHTSGLSSFVAKRKRIYSALKFTQEHGYSLSHIHNTFTYSFIQQTSF